MITRRLGGSVLRRHLFRSRNWTAPSRRAYSTPPPSFGGPPASPWAPLSGITSELDKIAPKFEVEASQIAIIETPGEFYETLKSKILNAHSRIFLSTLYVGRTEHDLVASIRVALLKHPNLRVSILTDALRGTRETPNPSCASLLVPLIQEFGSSRVEIRMFHTPNLTGLRKKTVPRRINEGWGLQHMKLYGIDDEIIISGANLSHDYFTNRQDRYHVFSSKRITDYFAGIHNAVCSLSFSILPDKSGKARYAVTWPRTNSAVSPLKSPKRFITHATSVIAPLIRPFSTSASPSGHTDTVVYPLAQFTPLLFPDTSTEQPGIVAVLRSLSKPQFASSKWLFTAGYFNIHPQLSSLLLSSKYVSGTVVTASPWANGFYGSPGVSGMLPAAYSLLSQRFLEQVNRAGLASQIVLKEWRRGTVGEPDGWTYHAKGLWVTLPHEENPSITLVGSSNYTKRSYSLDLEINTLVMTRNETLKKRLAQESAWLQKYANPMGIDDFAQPERKVGWHVRMAMRIVSLVGGAL